MCDHGADLGVITVESLIQFIDSGRNVLVAADTNVTDTIRELANECGLDFDDHNVNEVIAACTHFDNIVDSLSPSLSLSLSC